MNWNNEDHLETIELLATENGWIASEEELSEQFDNMVNECLECEGNTLNLEDTVMIEKLFNNWTDGLCKDGEIHEEQYNNYCYVGKYA